MARAVTRAKALGGSPVAVTFDPHPLKVLRPSKAPLLLSSLKERLLLFKQARVPAARVLPFNRAFSRWSPEEFARRFLVERLRVREVVVGHDFRFGANRAGTTDTLRELGSRYGFRVWVIPPVRVLGERVSSRRIRELIARADLKRAARMLGRPVQVAGRVIRGSGRGAQIGFPTANLKVESGLLPPIGVYAVYGQIGSHRYGGMANIGFRPTFQKMRGAPLLEVHLFCLRRSLYGRTLKVFFVRRLRPERRFPSAESLRRRLHRDALQAKRCLPSLSRGKRW